VKRSIDNVDLIDKKAAGLRVPRSFELDSRSSVSPYTFSIEQILTPQIIQVRRYKCNLRSQLTEGP
jgi:hypothetical protein